MRMEISCHDLGSWIAICEDRGFLAWRGTAIQYGLAMANEKPDQL